MPNQRPTPPGPATSRRPTTPGTSARSPTCTAAPASARRGRSCSATWRPGPRPASSGCSSPPALPPEEAEAIDGLRQTARSSSNLDLLKVCWLNRILHGPDPLREKLTLFWHGHFATSNKKVESVALMDRQNETLRTHALGGFAALLEAIIADPAMLVWLDGGTSKKDKPNENFAREFLELFTLGAGHYAERDIREAARAFTGWVRQDSRGGFQETPAFTHDAAQVDDGPKTFLGQTGPWGPSDIVRITLERPEAATFLARKLYRWFVSESGTPGPELIEPLAEEIKRHQFAIGPIVGVILRSRHFYSRSGLSPADQVAGRVQRGPGADARGAAAGAQPAGAVGRLRRAGPGAVRPAQRRGLGRRLDLDQQRHAARAHQLGRRRHLGPLRERPDARSTRWPGPARYKLPADRAAGAFLDLLLQDDLGDEARRLALDAGRDGSPDGLRKSASAPRQLPRVSTGLMNLESTKLDEDHPESHAPDSPRDAPPGPGLVRASGLRPDGPAVPGPFRERPGRRPAGARRAASWSWSSSTAATTG